MHRDRADRVVDTHLGLDPAARVVHEHGREHGDQVRQRRCVDVRAGRHADHAGEAAGDRPERVAAAREVAAGEAAREPKRDHHRDRAQCGRAQVDVRPPRERGRGDDQAGAVEGVEPGEDQHQAQRRDVQVVRPERARQALLRESAYPWAEVEEDPQRERARHAVHHPRGDRVMEAVAQGEPAAGAPAPGRVEDPHDGPQQRREHEVGRDARPLDDRAGHDRGGRPREEEERQEEDEVDVVGEVRAEVIAPGDAALADGRGEVRGVRADRQALLVAVVDPPAEVVERRRHHGDREDVLHRRRHHVLAARDPGFVGHEARVDQPHQDDGEEVELLAQDGGVLRQALRRGSLLERLDLGEDERQHPVPSRRPPMCCPNPRAAQVLSSGLRTGQCVSGPSFVSKSCAPGT